MREWVQKMGVVVLAGMLAGGCCSNPGVFSRLEESLKTVQTYYDPLLQELGGESVSDKVRQAIVAADTTLLLVAKLQGQWCPAEAAVEQTTLSAATVQKLAEEAGVKATAEMVQAAGRQGPN